MNRPAALFLLCALQAAPLCAQDFNKSLSQFKPKPYTAAADATYVKPSPVNMGAYGVMTALNAAGRNLTSANVVAKHANVHLGVIAGKYPGANVEHSARMLGLLGSSNSPLVGNAQAIPALLGGLYKAYTGGSDAQTKTTALVSIALIAGANPQVQLAGGKTCGDWALALFYSAVTNEDNPYETRRGAVIALAAMETPAAVLKISACITKLIADNGDGEDEVFSITTKDELVDEGRKGKSLVAALMLALEAQMDGAASAEAFKYMKVYAKLDLRDRSCNPRSMYGDPLGLELAKNEYLNKTTVLMARFILARESLAGTASGGKFAVMGSRIRSEDNGYGKTFLHEDGSARCLIPVIEDDGFKCETRKAFNGKYMDMVGNQFSYVSMPGNAPVRPVNFDNCLRAFTNKVMLNIAAEMVQGAVVGAVVKGAIRGAAWGLKNWSIDKAYKIISIGGRGSLARSAKYANFGGAVGQYEEGLIKLYNFYDDVKDPVDYANAVGEARK